MVTREIVVGKEGDYKVDDIYVSRRHAKIIYTGDDIYIEDLDSRNGVFVNGLQIKRKKVTFSDTIILGKEFVLDLDKLFQQLPLSDEDFSRAFLDLKKVYDEYDEKKVKIQSEGMGKMMLKRSLPMIIPGLIMIWAATFLGTFATIIGCAVSTAAMVAGIIWASKDISKIPIHLAELRKQFMLDYACPDCKHEFGERPWELIQRQGKCPYCRRKFKVENRL